MQFLKCYGPTPGRQTDPFFSPLTSGGLHKKQNKKNGWLWVHAQLNTQGLLYLYDMKAIYSHRYWSTIGMITYKQSPCKRVLKLTLSSVFTEFTFAENGSKKQLSLTILS